MLNFPGSKTQKCNVMCKVYAYGYMREICMKRDSRYRSDSVWMKPGKMVYKGLEKEHKSPTILEFAT